MNEYTNSVSAFTAHLSSVETPVGILDMGRVHRNVDRIVRYCAAHDLRWRPHVKSHKSIEIARLQMAAGAVGLTVATPREAEVMSRVTGDILMAYPPAGGAKQRRLMELPPHVDLKVALDATSLLEEVAREARAAGRSVGVFVKLDTGLHRVGVETPDEALALARLAEELEGVTYAGILFYPGHIRGPLHSQDDGLHDVAHRLLHVYETMDKAGLSPPVVSGGSTPTLWRSHEIPGVTEIRPGSCLFFDREQVFIGVAEWDDLAYTVLATVISTAIPGQATIDAGSKALAKETFPEVGPGYGVLFDRPEVPVISLNEEHGVLDLSGTDWRPRVSERVRIVPNHTCVSVNLQDSLIAVENDETRVIQLEARGRGPYRPSGPSA